MTPTVFQTIRGKMMLLFTGVFGITLISFSFVLYTVFERQTRTDFDRSLLASAMSVRETTLEDGMNEKEIFKEIEEIPLDFSKHQYLQIVDRKGTITISSKQLGNLSLPVSPGAIGKAFTGEKVFETKTGPEGKLWDRWGVRLLLVRDKESSAAQHVIIIGVPLSGLEKMLFGFRIILICAIPITLLIAAIGGWFLAKRAFDPIERIINEAALITSANLHRRLPVAPVQDELSKLSQTLNQMIERLERSFQAQKQFTADASHELRTPLTILKGEMEVALQKPRETKEYEELLNSSLEEVQRLQKIVGDLLFLSQIESGKMTLHCDEVRLDELLIAAVKKVIPIAKSKKIEITLKLEENEQNEIVIDADSSKLINVFLNLLDNAVKYSPQDSAVRCSLTMSEGQAMVSITDNGSGVPAEHIGRIFDRFYRVEHTRTNETSGTGLGLAIAKAVVEAHKGTIALTSEIAKGTTVNVSFPLVKPAA